MRAAGHPYLPLSPEEEETIHRNLLRLVARVGLQVENDLLLDAMAGIGGQVEGRQRRVTFTPARTEAFIAICEPFPWDEQPPRLTGGAHLYYGHYLDPRDDAFKPVTADRAREYMQVALALPHISGRGMLGCPFPEVPLSLSPLYERYWAWRLGIQPHGAVHDIRLCPYIKEMCQVHAAVSGQAVERVLTATGYLVPPLKLARPEAEQLVWFWQRGLRMRIGGSMPTGGLTAPVTLAGMVTVDLAESLLLSMLNHALYGDRVWRIGMSVTAADARTMMRPYGRPDAAIANLVGAQMARRYRAPFAGHGGNTDAARPSPQAAAQKIMSALPLLLAAGSASIQAGLLAVDEVFSPVQMALDDEAVSAMAQFAEVYAISDEAIAADLIEAVGPGGSWAGEMHTAQWFRRELWEPALWERRPFGVWHESDGRTDVDRARQRVLEILAEPPPADQIGAAEEQALCAILSRAANR